MAKLTSLRNRIALLRMLRSVTRIGAALATVALALVVILLCMFAIDYSFGLFVEQRIFLLVLAGITAIIAFVMIAWKPLTTRESEMDVALLVEHDNQRQNQTPTDVVAGLQFDTPAAASWGSTQLSGAVVETVGSMAPRIRVMDSLKAGNCLMAVAAVAVVAALIAFLANSQPDYFRAFFARMSLADVHYPTLVSIDELYVNQTVALTVDREGHTPEVVAAPQGAALHFAAIASGRLGGADRVAAGSVQLRSQSGQQSELELTPLDTPGRVNRLVEARTMLEAARADNDVSLAKSQEMKRLLQLDAPKVLENLLSAKEVSDLDTLISVLNGSIQNPPESWSSTLLYVGEWERFFEPLDYRVRIGDARTNWGKVEMTPLPIVQLEMTPLPPSYARTGKMPKADPSVRQISVLEGSDVDLALISTNGKPLASARFTALIGEEEFVRELEAVDEDALRWTLDLADSPLENIQQPVRFKIDLEDTDGLSTDQPIEGSIRLREDRKPSGLLSLTNRNRAVLPEAKPRITYAASDDFGVSQILLKLKVSKGSPTESGVDPPEDLTAGNDFPGGEINPPSETELDSALMSELILLDRDRRVLGDQLPYQQTYAVDLAGRGLTIGDQVDISLTVIDYRGESPGESYETDPITLYITDKQGVMAGLAELYETFEKRSNELLELELGIGE